MSKTLDDHHIVVTGGLGGLGRAVVAALRTQGAICHIPHRGAARDLPMTDPGIHLVPGVDLTDMAAVSAFYDAVPDLWASIHLAGGFAMAPLAELGAVGFRQQMDMNALTVLLCCRAAVAGMRRAGRGGRIVNVAARPALEPRKGSGMVAYAASKAAVASLTQALAEELKHDRILVNAIAPSTIDTPANRAAMPKADPDRWLAPQAAAAAIVHLVAPENHEISGAVLPLYARA